MSIFACCAPQYRYGVYCGPHHSLADGKELRSSLQPCNHSYVPAVAQIAIWDAVFYVLFQLAGGLFGVGVSWLALGKSLADPGVDYAVTVPGKYGTAAAFAAELFMTALLMGVVLWTSNRPHLARYTSYSVGILIAFYILLFAPVSGFSINPARTVGSAVFARLWTAGWVYFTAPLIGMMGVAEVYLRSYGADRILCAKLHPDPDYSCPFRCHLPFHRHPVVSVLKEMDV